MNSNYGKSGKSASLNNYEFDFGLNTSRSRSLNDQKNNRTPSYSSSSFASTQTKPNTTNSWQPNKPSWTHQPAPSQSGRPGLGGPTSMVGDIFGKSWASSTTSTTASPIGIVNKNPTLFGDLVSSAIGQNKVNNNNVPLKNATPSSSKSAYAMGGMADSLPKTGSSVKSSGSLGSTESFGGYTSASNNSNEVNSNFPNLGGPSMHSLGGSGGAGGARMGSNRDPFGSLVDFGSKPGSRMSPASKGSSKNNSGDDASGDFQNASKSSASSFQSSVFPLNNTSVGSSTGSFSKMDDFGIPISQNPPPAQSPESNDFDALFYSSSTLAGVAAKDSNGVGSQLFSGSDEWGFNSEFGGGNDAGGTTELEGLPPPPAGVSASAAKNKGMDNHKQGQYADAIKWLSWAVILLERAGDDDATVEVLSCRASCYKEVGEYKKAVADCTKVLEHDGTNVSVLVQRALLYESMEKYKLGAEDLRTVMKIDPSNRVARSTIHRLTKMIG